MSNISTTFVDSVKEWASSIPEIEGVILYGSRAKGAEKPNSDWDICIDIQESPLNDWLGIWIEESDKWKKGFCEAAGLKESEVQFVTFTSDIVKNGVKECSIVLYQKKNR